MKVVNSDTCLAFAALLAATISSCSFLEDPSARQTIKKLACYSSISLCRTEASSFSDIPVQCLDVFIYNNDEAGHLDSHQHISMESQRCPDSVQAASRAGDKTAVIMANLPEGSYGYMDIISLEAISRMQVSMMKETSKFPVMAGQCNFTAGPGQAAILSLEPLRARVRIRDFSVDFSSRQYNGEELTDIRTYLINVNTVCPCLSPGAAGSSDLINCGRYESQDVRVMADSSLICRSGPPANTALYCYPCSKKFENDPATMLVIEGRIDGNIYYYPIMIGSGTVEPAKEYVYDIHITRSGGIRPDVPIEEGAVAVGLEINEWTDYEWENVDY